MAQKEIAPQGAIEGVQKNTGGATQSRTGLDGFAIRCITALLSRHGQSRLTKKQMQDESTAQNLTGV
jgi:hypothetical protein